MERGTNGRGNSAHSSSPFDSFGTQRSMMPSIFGGRDPFDDPFFSRPFGPSMFGSSASSSGDSPRVNLSKEPVIEELHTDDEGEEDEDEHMGAGEKKDKTRKKIGINDDPLVQHPEDQADERKNKDVAYLTNYNKTRATQPQAQSVSFQRVTCGGINGAYYTATMTRTAGSDGVVREESKQADKTTGQATHIISRGIHDKGHSLTRKLDSDGKVDTMQTLHNMNEDELSGFEQVWEGNAERRLPGWHDGFHFHGNTGSFNYGEESRPTRALPQAETFRRGHRPNGEARTSSSGGRPRKVVTINIE